MVVGHGAEPWAPCPFRVHVGPSQSYAVRDFQNISNKNAVKDAQIRLALEQARAKISRCQSVTVVLLFLLVR